MAVRKEAKDAEVRLDLPPKLYPLLVTFRDINDPKSITRVDPTAFSSTFGPGVSLKRIMVEATNNPVTTGIDKRLAWLNYLDRYRTDSENPFTSTLPNEIGSLRSK